MSLRCLTALASAHACRRSYGLDQRRPNGLVGSSPATAELIARFSVRSRTLNPHRLAEFRYGARGCQPAPKAAAAFDNSQGLTKNRAVAHRACGEHRAPEPCLAAHVSPAVLSYPDLRTKREGQGALKGFRRFVLVVACQPRVGGDGRAPLAKARWLGGQAVPAPKARWT